MLPPPIFCHVAPGDKARRRLLDCSPPRRNRGTADRELWGVVHARNDLPNAQCPAANDQTPGETKFRPLPRLSALVRRSNSGSLAKFAAWAGHRGIPLGIQQIERNARISKAWKSAGQDHRPNHVNATCGGQRTCCWPRRNASLGNSANTATNRDRVQNTNASLTAE